MTADQHAQEASRILSQMKHDETYMSKRHEDESNRMQDYARGATAAYNRHAEWALKVAQAHALAAIALRGGSQ